LKAKKAKAILSINKKISKEPVCKAKADTKKCPLPCCPQMSPAQLAKKEKCTRVGEFMSNWMRHAEFHRGNGLLRLNKQRRWHKRELDLAN